MKPGDCIRIDSMEGEPQYSGKQGVVEYVDDIGQLHGTWGGLAVIPGVDKFTKVNQHGKKLEGGTMSKWVITRKLTGAFEGFKQALEIDADAVEVPLDAEIDVGGAVAHFNGFAIPLEPGDRVNRGRVCPKCGRTYTEYPALSRADNVTEICPECGTREALEAFKGYQEGR